MSPSEINPPTLASQSTLTSHSRLPIIKWNVSKWNQPTLRSNPILASHSTLTSSDIWSTLISRSTLISQSTLISHHRPTHSGSCKATSWSTLATPHFNKSHYFSKSLYFNKFRYLVYFNKSVYFNESLYFNKHHRPTHSGSCSATSWSTLATPHFNKSP